MTKQLTTINPATEEVINTYDIATNEKISKKTKKAQSAFLDWKKDIQKRADHIHDFAQELIKNKEELARKITQEMGKAIEEARSLCYHYIRRPLYSYAYLDVAVKHYSTHALVSRL